MARFRMVIALPTQDPAVDIVAHRAPYSPRPRSSPISGDLEVAISIPEQSGPDATNFPLNSSSRID